MDKRVKEEKAKIDGMSQFQLCSLLRFAPVGHPYFVRDTELADHFDKAYQASGGMTPQISKQLGWG